MNIDEIVEGIQSETKNKRNKALKHLYNNCFPQVKGFVLGNSGDMDEAEDVFQDTIATVYVNLVERRFRGESSLYAYVYSIARNTWLMKLRKKKIPTHSLTDAIMAVDESEEQVNTRVIQRVMQHLDEGCRKLLVGFYFESMSMQAIAEIFELGSTQAAKTKKLRCMKRLSKIVHDQGMEKDHFML